MNEFITGIKTGELHFQFDEDESIKLYDINDYGSIQITIGQDKDKNLENSIKFVDINTNKTFKLFIK